MIYFCADDYALEKVSSERIAECAKNGILNKVSVFPNFGDIDFEKFSGEKNVRLSLHLNLVEGKCMAEAKKIGLIADENGCFIHTFGGLLKSSILYGKRFYEQVYEEIRAQVVFWKNALPEGVPLFIDSHQHTHMIPKIFRALIDVLENENIEVGYLRIPAEPLMPFLKTPSLYATYSPVNIIKQWLLKFLWAVNKPIIRKKEIPTAYFFGILFSGKMDRKRVEKILPHYIALSEKHKMDTEVLFHPGYIEDNLLPDGKNIVFNKFYLSENRKAEYDAVMNIRKEVFENALY